MKDKIQSVGSLPEGSLVETCHLGSPSMNYYQLGRHATGETRTAYERFTGHKVTIHCGNLCRVVSSQFFFEE